MIIDDALLVKLETLSHLRVDETKKEEIKQQLSDILDYVESLEELDTSNLDPHFGTLPSGTPLREDNPQSQVEIPKSILVHAPQSEDDFFIVPAIIK